MKEIDKVLEVLQDSRWHNIEEIEKQITLSDEKFYEILHFLEDQTFIEKMNNKIRITPRGLKMLHLPT